MQILSADWLFDGQDIHPGYAVAFDSRIQAVGAQENLHRQFPDARSGGHLNDALIIPGLVNPHLHLEFSANATQLTYGAFIPWLQSVIRHRETLMDECRLGCIKKALDTLLACGTTAIGAVSSYGLEIKACAAAPQRVVLFNEAIGSRPDALDALYADFMQRLELSRAIQSETLIPAVAVHSPYSVHPVLIRKVLETVRRESLPLTAHFMESPAEREWLQSGTGPFSGFFKEFLGQTKPMHRPEAFLEHFNDLPTLLTHAVQASPKHLETIRAHGHTLIHCPRSNRLLGCGRLDLERLERMQIPWVLGTDGLSSNTSLSLWDEMRATLMMHEAMELNDLAQQLLRGVTQVSARGLGLECGVLQPGKRADLAVIALPGKVDSAETVPIQAILHTQKAKNVWIGGKEVYSGSR